MNHCLSANRRLGKTARTLFGLAALGLVTAIVAAASVNGETGLAEKTPEIVSAKEVGKAFTQVTREVTPAVVFVRVEKKMPVAQPMDLPGLEERFGDDFLRKFFGDKMPDFKNETPRSPRSATGQGSGFIISEDGYILTNAHVVGGADHVHVTLADGREFEAEIVGTDSRSDVAVVKVDAKDLPVLPLGNSDDLEPGEWVLAVGSPFGLPGTVTSGIVSATGRNRVGIADYENFIQTDAAINPGNSGGPLVNLRGEAVGINTAIFSRSGGYMGIGFAIPINMARDICDQLIADGSVSRGYLGVMIQELTQDLAKSFGLESSDGVLIGDVTKDSPAAKAGLKSGDVVVRLEGQDVKNLGEFRNRVAQTRPGSKVKLEVVREGDRKTLEVTIGELPGSEEVAAAADVDDTMNTLGFSVRELSPEWRERLKLSADATGLVITKVESGSPADRAGLESGMLLLQVNRQAVNNVAEFQKVVDAAAEAKDESVLLLVREGDYTRYVAVRFAG